jgi:hypothetical protein
MTLKKYLADKRLRQHKASIQEVDQGLIDYFNSCRVKRNTADYDAAGSITDSEAIELYNEAIDFRKQVIGWIGSTVPKFLPKDIRCSI